MERAPNFMNQFNNELEDKRLRTLEQFLESTKNEKSPQERTIHRQQLREMLEVEDLDLNDLRKIFNNLHINLELSPNTTPQNIVDVLLPTEIPANDTDKENEENDYKITKIDDTLVPTEPGQEGIKPKERKYNFQEKETIHRTGMLVSLLAENGIPSEQYAILKGVNKKNMVRKDSYAMLLVPSLENIILVCDEEGNATFVIHDFVSEPKEYYQLNKQQLRAHPKVEEPIRWSNEENWKLKILDALTNPDPKYQQVNLSKEEIARLMEEIKISFGREKKEMLPYEQFIAEVRKSGINSITEYNKEYKNHNGWPADPRGFYQDKGWASWPEFFGREKNNN